MKRIKAVQETNIKFTINPVALLKGKTNKEQLKNALKTVQQTLKALKATKVPRASRSLKVKSVKAVKVLKNQIK